MNTESPEIIECKFITPDSRGRLLKQKGLISYNKGRIEFVASPFALKDEIKAMRGSKWHGYIDGDNRKIWSVDDCPRNRFQLAYLQGEDVYAWFDRPLVNYQYDRPVRDYQKEMADNALTYHFNIWAAEMGLGKTLAAIEVMEKSGAKEWFWIGPKKPIAAVRREFKKWDVDPSITITTMTYEAFTRFVDDWKPGDVIPQGLIGDEFTRCKTGASQRSQAMQFMADKMREKYGYDAYVILMSGTPSPKSPVDWWSPAEIAFPGFLKEGSEKACKLRLGFVAPRSFGSGGTFNEMLGWKDDESKCGKCGCYRDEHDMDMDDYHPWEPSINEVALLYERLKGLVIVKLKKDCLDLPEKQYRIVHCEPKPSTLRVAQALMGSAERAVQGLTLLRELSDGFQYREVQEGTSPCGTCHQQGEAVMETELQIDENGDEVEVEVATYPNAGSTGVIKEWFDPSDETRVYSSIDMLRDDVVAGFECRDVVCPKCEGEKEVPRMVRYSKEVPCPKEDALIDLLGENEEHGRVVIFAGFTGSVDRCVNICLREDWHVVRCDGRGFTILYRDHDGTIKTNTKMDALDYWADLPNNARVAFVAHPESGGMGLTLTEACMAIFYSNTYKPEYRSQAEDRVHRLGMDENRGCIIVDIVHLPTDEKVLEVLRKNRELELMSMGEFAEGLQLDPAA